MRKRLAVTLSPNFVLFRSLTSCVCGLQESIGTERSAQEGNEVCREKASEPPSSGGHPGSPSLGGHTLARANTLHWSLDHLAP